MYVKLFSSILASSIWSEDVTTRLAWIALLAMADQDGFVRGSDDGLARMANLPQSDFERALATLAAPDPRRPGQEFDGRRVERLLEGVQILNYAKYRELKDPDIRREQTRERVRKHRERRGLGDVTHPVTPGNAPKRQAEAEAEADTTTTHAARFSNSGQLDAYLALRSAASYPPAFDALLGAVVEPPSGGVAYGWPIVGRALQDLYAANGAQRATGAQIRAFCRRLVSEDAQPTGRPLNKIEQGREALKAGLRRHGAIHGEPARHHEVPRAFPRAVPDEAADGLDGGGVGRGAA